MAKIKRPKRGAANEGPRLRPRKKPTVETETNEEATSRTAISSIFAKKGNSSDETLTAPRTFIRSNDKQPPTSQSRPRDRSKPQVRAMNSDDEDIALREVVQPRTLDTDNPQGSPSVEEQDFRGRQATGIQSLVRGVSSTSNTTDSAATSENQSSSVLKAKLLYADKGQEQQADERQVSEQEAKGAERGICGHQASGTQNRTSLSQGHYSI